MDKELVPENRSDRPPSPVDLALEDIREGDTAAFTRRISNDDVVRFSTLSGDFNPLHTDPDYASTTNYKDPVVHGMFLASLLSRLVGMHLPGRRCLYLSQSIDFVSPVYVGDEVQVTATVLKKQTETRTLLLRTEIHVVPDKLALRGKAHVAVL